MAISVERDSPTYQDMTADAEEIVTEALRDLARWLYRQLEREYDYLTSDAAVDEAITANEYTFADAGRWTPFRLTSTSVPPDDRALVSCLLSLRAERER